MTMRSRWSRGLVTAAALLATACGGGDDDDDSNAGPVCPNDDVTMITLRDVSPAHGASVTNDAILHEFTTVGVDAQFATLHLLTLGTHTAGPIPSPTRFESVPVSRPDGSGLDFTYRFTITWPTAPGHVSL